MSGKCRSILCIYIYKRLGFVTVENNPIKNLIFEGIFQRKTCLTTLDIG